MNFQSEYSPLAGSACILLCSVPFPVPCKPIFKLPKADQVGDSTLNPFTWPGIVCPASMGEQGKNK
jgi:hypothetical protein